MADSSPGMDGLPTLENPASTCPFPLKYMLHPMALNAFKAIGYIKLTGVVNSRLEYRAATKNALEGAAVRVDNRISVQPQVEANS